MNKIKLPRENVPKEKRGDLREQHLRKGLRTEPGRRSFQGTSVSWSKRENFFKEVVSNTLFSQRNVSDVIEMEMNSSEMRSD